MVTIVWMVLGLVAAFMVLVVLALCIGGVLGPVAMAALARPPAGWAESRYEEPSGLKSPDVACRVPFVALRANGTMGMRTTSTSGDRLNAEDLEVIQAKTREERARIRERNGVRHGAAGGEELVEVRWRVIEPVRMNTDALRAIEEKYARILDGRATLDVRA